MINKDAKFNLKKLRYDFPSLNKRKNNRFLKIRDKYIKSSMLTNFFTNISVYFFNNWF